MRRKIRGVRLRGRRSAARQHSREGPRFRDVLEDRADHDRQWNRQQCSHKTAHQGGADHHRDNNCERVQSHAFADDSRRDNKIFQQTKLTIPVLAVGGEKSFGAMEATVMRNVATNVREAVVQGAGHWLMEENPTTTIALIRDFLKG